MNYFLSKNKFINDNQSGFISGHSCISALLNVIGDIRIEIDTNKINILKLLDLSKAFDSIDHATLCNKLAKFYNFTPSAVNFLRSYLIGRNLAVCINGNKSMFLPLTRAFNHAPVLGPLLFSLYINDFP